MKITKIEILPLTIPYKKPRQMRGQIMPGSQKLLVKMHTDEGITGIGEVGGGGGFGYTGDSGDAVIGFLNSLGRTHLLGQDPTKIELIMSRLHRAAKYSKGAKMVVDSCLHDIVGKKLGVPAYRLLGGLSNEKIQLAWVIGYGTVSTAEEAAERAEQLKAHGYEAIKLKVSHDSLEDDLRLVESVREAAGWDMRLAIDANGGWDYFQALTALKKMEKYDILMCEQPVPWTEIDSLARLRQKVGIPICADESAVELVHLLEIIEKDAVDALFIKLEKVGGISIGQKWVAIAQAAGLPVSCGCMVGSGVETAYQAQFLAASEWMGHLEQENLGVLIIHDQFETVKQPITDDIVKNVLRVENGYMYPPDGPGIGVELNEELVAEFMTKGKSPIIVEERERVPA